MNITPKSHEKCSEILPHFGSLFWGGQQKLFKISTKFPTLNCPRKTKEISPMNFCRVPRDDKALERRRFFAENCRCLQETAGTRTHRKPQVGVRPLRFASFGAAQNLWQKPKVPPFLGSPSFFLEKNKGGGKRRGAETYHKTPPQKWFWTPPPIMCFPPLLSCSLEARGTDQTNPTF